MPPMPSLQPLRAIAAHVFDQAMILDAVGPLQVFSSVNDELAVRGQPPAYRVLVTASAPGPVTMSGGLRLYADAGVGDWPDLELDTLLVSGGRGVDLAARDEVLLAALRGLEPRIRRLGSICSGALVLAGAGLLDGRPATTHWSRVEQLRRDHPAVRVLGDRLHTHAPEPGPEGDPHLFTSAGVTAGIDLALSLVEADVGVNLARAAARRLVMFLRRPGGQNQFSAFLEPALERAPRLAELLVWIPGNLNADLSLEALAQRANMSTRSFSRLFRDQLGSTPAAYVERVRVEAARAELAASGPDASVGAVARAAGFGHPETMRRAFHRYLGIGPSDYAARFGVTLAPPPSFPSSSSSPSPSLLEENRP
ncbi:MAG: helix-turn-helix domain-containing protein [Rhodospirillum sp.]|nr:helix-turn-helix domain-containing protein [Rhodospirillum sp.]MCF8500894.1 helix-turn-helix domain-containing protein [Rhodospirillum sp.]